MRWTAALGISLWLAGSALPAWAQDEQTLADIRQELNVLFVEIQKLRRELSTSGTGGVNAGGGSVLDRVTAMEGELQRLTARTERLEFRVEQVVKDGTNRIGDLEFRLVELEGGDISTLGETTTLGGNVAPAPVSVTPVAPTGSDLAVGERADFQAAQADLSAGRYQQAAAKFAAFNGTYPGSPLAAEASLRRGEALRAQGDTREAARSFLQSYSTEPAGPHAPRAVLELGRALGRLGKTKEACVTLGEISVRYPGSDAVADAQRELAALDCG